MANEFLSQNDEIVDGSYRLGAVIKRSIRSTVYKTEFGEDGLPAVIKIREYESPESDELLERWRNAMELAHPNLLKIYAAGSSVLNGAPIVYVVMERADESLKSVLTERALTPDETRELIEPSVAALQYLHKHGYAHSRLGPSNVLAVQDQLKLSSDNAIRVNDGGSTTEDMKALGVLIFQALTQQIPNGDGQLELDSLRKAPDPIPNIVRHCLDPDPARRWTAEQVESCVKKTGGRTCSTYTHAIGGHAVGGHDPVDGHAIDNKDADSRSAREATSGTGTSDRDSRDSFEDRHSEMDIRGDCGADSDCDSVRRDAEEGCGSGGGGLPRSGCAAEPGHGNT